MKPPIIIHILDENTLAVYPSVEAAERSMEAIDVADGLYLAYDSEGRRLNIIPDGFVGQLHPSGETVVQVEELRQRLLKQLESLGLEVRAAAFDELLRVALTTTG